MPWEQRLNESPIFIVAGSKGFEGIWLRTQVSGSMAQVMDSWRWTVSSNIDVVGRNILIEVPI